MSTRNSVCFVESVLFGAPYAVRLAPAMSRCTDHARHRCCFLHFMHYTTQLCNADATCAQRSECRPLLRSCTAGV